MLISVHCAFSQRDTTLCPWDIHQTPFNSLLWGKKLCFLHQTAYRGYTGVDSRPILPHAPPAKPEKGFLTSIPWRKSKRAERFWPRTVLPRSVSPEEMQGKGGNLQQQRESALLAGIQAWSRAQVMKMFLGAAYDFKPFIYIIKSDWKGNIITESK